MPFLFVHPSIKLLLWLLALLLVQGLSGIALVSALLLLPFLGKRALMRGGHLVWRARWLLMTLLVVFSWGIAGEPLWNVYFSPSREGLIEASLHLARLLLVLISVAAVLEYMPLPELLAATRTLLGPVRKVGLDPDRGVIRLMLVLHYVEELPRPRDWRKLLEQPDVCVNQTVVVADHPLRSSDIVILVASLLVAGFFCLT